MKKIFLMMAAAMAVLAGCNKSPVEDEPSGPQIKLSRSTYAAPAAGDLLNITVTSPGDWTLEEDATWIEPNVTSGVSGDVVAITIKPNTLTERQTAEVKFTSGTAEATLKITIQAKPASSTQLVLNTSANEDISNAAKAISIEFETDLLLSEVNVDIEIVSGAPDWLTFDKKTMVITGKLVVLVNAAANTDLEPRVAEVTVSGGDASQLITITQAQTDKISVDTPSAILDLEGGEVVVNVTANTAYTATVNAEATGWLTFTKVGDKYTVKAAAITDDTILRDGTITFKANEGSAQATVKVTQKKAAVINYVAYMGANISGTNYNRAVAKWAGNTEGISELRAWTMETLVNATWNKGGATTNKMSTVMGIEGVFMVRVGDAGGTLSNQLQVCWNNDDSTYAGKEGKFIVAGVPANQWLHLAVTVDMDADEKVCVYFDGVKQTNAKTPANSGDELIPLNLSVYNEAEVNQQAGKRNFWCGYAYAADRYLDGMVSEMRIWNKALSSTTLAEVARRYTVPADSEGLVSYWKFNDASGSNIKDYTSRGNDLSCDQAPRWDEVSLP